ncbi:hypothetical protein H4219_006422, partial [Mycoemilia scoparia]
MSLESAMNPRYKVIRVLGTGKHLKQGEEMSDFELYHKIIRVLDDFNDTKSKKVHEAILGYQYFNPDSPNVKKLLESAIKGMKEFNFSIFEQDDIEGTYTKKV